MFIGNKHSQGVDFATIKKTVIVFGIGKLGGPVVDALALLHPHHRYVLVSRNAERSALRANLVRYLAAQKGYYPEVLGDETDLLDFGRTAELIQRHQPDVVFNATTPFPWWKIDDLPERERILSSRAGPGMWCALDCLLPMSLTNALIEAGTGAVHVNACYPDMTNAFLSGRIGAPRLGIGNISNLVPGLQLGYAAKLDVSAKDISIQMVGHHYVSWNAPSDRGCPDAPYALSVSHTDGQLNYLGPDDTPFEILRRNASRVRGLDGLRVTIGSAVNILDVLLGGTSRFLHSPGVNGLPGGYPIHLDSSGGVTLNLPTGLTESQAIELNRHAQVLDGVLNVEPGKVRATPMAQEAYKKVVGVELPEVTTKNVNCLSIDAIERIESRYNLGIKAR